MVRFTVRLRHLRLDPCQDNQFWMNGYFADTAKLHADLIWAYGKGQNKRNQL